MKSPIPIDQLDASAAGIADAVTLPPSTMTSREFFEFELDAIWYREWFCVGHTSDIPSTGDYYTVTVGPEPLIVLRDNEGDVRILSAVCQHRGMIIAEDRGHAKRFRCPYHSWVYGLDGGLRSAPDLNDDPTFDKSEVCLPRIRSTVWEGFIFANFDDDAEPLEPRLAHLSEQLANWELTTLRAAAPLTLEEGGWNWKIFADECYHCTYLHGGSWGKMFPTPSSAVDTATELADPERGILAYELIGREPGSMPTRTGKALQPFLPRLTERQLSRLHYVTVMPNLLLICMADKVKYFLWLPKGPTESVSAFAWLYPESTLARPDFHELWEMEKGDLGEVVEEDWFAWSTVQRGMRSRYAPRGRLAPHESLLLDFNRWLIERYRAADDAASAAPVA